eukprot:TRINITY_DN1175_c0_g1_i1.p1 TRINITY_DN1175_c0_g1~~TRINITY_DN1175_c0_g1_i1.p1  ORF type:complete len:925 (-),score=157.35 TRINITY_DN1175_c0_g1_i1:415-3189(-)
MRALPLLPLFQVAHVACAWNSALTQDQFYTFQDFYSDAQYGADFGYYSTGRILHGDGPADNGQGDVEANNTQQWFNSYTTLPMSLSPHFAHALCDRLATMWQAMGQPQSFVIAEFGGGTGMLARDLLRRARDAHRDFYDALAVYAIAERSQALRTAQVQTAGEFVSAGKLKVLRADAREAEASALKPALLQHLREHQVDGKGENLSAFDAQQINMEAVSKETIGFVISNELLDEFDPVRLRLMWKAGAPPDQEYCRSCSSYREAHVVHFIDQAALLAILEAPDFGASLDEHHVHDEEALRDIVTSRLERIRWEGEEMYCGILTTPQMKSAMLALSQQLTMDERLQCAPALVCCSAFALAVNQALQFKHEAVDIANGSSIDANDALRKQTLVKELLNLYRHRLTRMISSVPLTKERYRELRKYMARKGLEAEKALLVGSPREVLPSGSLPGRVHSEEIFLVLGARRCRELAGYLRRHAARMSQAAFLRDGTSWIFDGDAEAGRTAIHLKLVIRPGEAGFAEQAAKLLDEGFMVTFDYGADADALIWQSLVRPNYEGIHIVDARAEFQEDCTAISFLECPGMQDLTTSVDFSEFAQAGAESGGWAVKAYGPIFLMELSFHETRLELAQLGDPHRLGHLVERAVGVTTTGLQAWYLKPEEDPWASFKMLVQHRGHRGGDWSLGSAGSAWPLHGTPRLLRGPSSCWRQDVTKPPLASMITEATHTAIQRQGGATFDDMVSAYGSTAQGQLPCQQDANTTTVIGPDASSGLATPESKSLQAEMLRQFQAVLMKSEEEPLTVLLNRVHDLQQQAYADIHLALLIVDYFLLLLEADEQHGTVQVAKVLEEVRSVASSRRFPELYEEEHFERVFGDVKSIIIALLFPPPVSTEEEKFCRAPRAGYMCLAELALADRLLHASGPTGGNCEVWR